MKGDFYRYISEQASGALHDTTEVKANEAYRAAV